MVLYNVGGDKGQFTPLETGTNKEVGALVSV